MLIKGQDEIFDGIYMHTPCQPITVFTFQLYWREVGEWGGEELVSSGHKTKLGV